MAKYYSVYDLQNHRYMATGSNSKTKQEAMLDILNYILIYMTEAEILTIKEATQEDKELEAFISAYDFRIDEHNKKINYD